jgi:hypothetical protein
MRSAGADTRVALLEGPEPPEHETCGDRALDPGATAYQPASTAARSRCTDGVPRNVRSNIARL